MIDQPPAGPTPLSVEGGTVSRRNRPEDHLVRWRWFEAAVAAGTLLTFGLLCAVSRVSGGLAPLWWGLGTLLGMAITFVGMSWGAVVALLDDAKRGLLYAVFPPYLVYLTIVRWRLLRQPTIVFLCGLGLAIVCLLQLLALVERLEAQSTRDGGVTGASEGRSPGSRTAPVNLTVLAASAYHCRIPDGTAGSLLRCPNGLLASTCLSH